MPLGDKATWHWQRSPAAASQAQGEGEDADASGWATRSFKSFTQQKPWVTRSLVARQLGYSVDTADQANCPGHFCCCWQWLWLAGTIVSHIWMCRKIPRTWAW